ncbi:cerebellin 18 [Pseudoliparis swirei]|uniref:cerebellin 18 n=1 Tax=Pseudoliparis swirei TaxID=2059687 RepID=UPI0024BE2C81|nr:cerebellin 18 [Pseudoliparis swirei]
MVVFPLVLLLAWQFLCGRGHDHDHDHVQSAGVALLTEAALQWRGPLPCGQWDCDCTFNQQRGCCCAANQMFRLEDHSFKRIHRLWHDVISLDYRVKILTDYSRISFNAVMDPSNSNMIYGPTLPCFGPFNTNVPIPYSIVSFSDGHAYNPSLGIFTAPCSGVYVFSFTVYSSVGEAKLLYHKVQLMVNGVVAVSVWENNREDFEDNANQVVVLQLQRGDQVYVELVAGRKLCSHLENNIFTGYMLYPDTDEDEH